MVTEKHGCLLNLFWGRSKLRSLRSKKSYAQSTNHVPQESVGAVMEWPNGNAVILWPWLDWWKSGECHFIKSHWRKLSLISFDKLKSSTVLCASFDYELSEYRPSKLVKWISFSMAMYRRCPQLYRSQAILPYERGKLIVEKPKKIIPRQQFPVPIQRFHRS